jgi:hypothetical protein
MSSFGAEEFPVMPKLFISYRRDDTIGVAGRIYDRLAMHFGRDNVFMDVDAIPFGVDFRQHLNDAVSRCDVLVAVIGTTWLGSSQAGLRRLDDPKDFVRIEIETALQRGIPVIPVLIAPASLALAADLPETLRELAYRNALEIDPGRDFHNHLDRLIRGIEFSTPESVPDRSSGTPPKYYVYVSEHKIRMLYGQTSHGVAEPSDAALGFDINSPKGSVKGTLGVPETGVIRLRTVLNELGRTDLVGAIDEPKPYIRGALAMVWAGYGWASKKEAPITFWGHCSDKIILGMAGSSYHVLGNQRGGIAHSHSLTPAIMEWFRENLDEPIPPPDENARFTEMARERARKLGEHDIANATWLAVTQMKGYQVKFEFVAKVLHRSHWPEGFRLSAPNTTIILASPIYVAMDE